ncbi:cytochrome c oxidase subunit 3 [Novosphingobium sp.]|uniref:cytochrome c oxidase subunit 3 n=1 Tax=Novosphingobium sp. TaxID=1874826 RepID=UPI003BAC825D
MTTMTANAPVHAETVALPGDSGVWFFILADMCAFAVFFLVFSAGRAANPALYEASRQMLDLRFGLANTLILLTSGAFMAAAARAAQHANWRGTQRMLIATLLSGLPFGISKALEWRAKLALGVDLTTNEFFTYYFVFTGVHFLHFVIGIGVLVVLLRTAGDTTRPAATRLRWIEAGGAYWHMVDILWIVLFAMLYLLRTL